MTKADKARVAFIKVKLANDRRWAITGLTRIYEYQTRSEQLAGTTQDHNGVGFNGVDGGILSSFAQQVHSRGYDRLSEKQMRILYKKMPKYAKQLLKLSDIDHLDNIMKKES